jgi:hypothetical protein
MICFVMNNMVPDIGLVNIYRGAPPFIMADFVWLALMPAYIAPFLVHRMS